MRDLAGERQQAIQSARSILERAKADGDRDFTAAEDHSVKASMALIKELDVQLKGRALVQSVMSLGSSDGGGFGGDTSRFMSLRKSGTKAKVASRAADDLFGTKALNGGTSPLVTVELDPTPHLLGRPATSLLEILPSVVMSPVFRWMQQTTRTNNAAPVAPGGLKPTSVYSLTAVDARLKVIAHLSEAVDIYQLRDGPGLMQFIGNEMMAGLHDAVEQQLVSGTGVGENLKGLNATSGIQTQAYATSQVLTARNAITKVELLGHAPYYFVLHPNDWQSIETSTLSAGQYVLNAEGGASGAGLPVDAALRRLWGVPVSVTTAVAPGTGFLISSDCVQVATDGVVGQEWSANHADDFGRNQTRLRIESRFDLMVTRPLGVVKMALSGA
jgi:HK97 family phage major capsid protein